MYWVGKTDSSTYNFPEDSINGWLQVIKAENEIIVKQIFYRYGTKNSTGNYTYIRTSYNDGWSEWVKLVTNNDLGNRFAPVQINGNSGGTFSGALRNKLYNSIVFIAFAGNTENPIPDNPFSFQVGYGIVFHSGNVDSQNIFEIIGVNAIGGTGQPLTIEVRRVDFR